MTVELVVACTKRKRGEGGDALRLRDLPTGTADQVAEEWLRQARRHPRRPAHSVYAGAGWRSALEAWRPACVANTGGLHVISAGFGLIDAQTEIPLYSASFAMGEDQVASRLTSPADPLGRHQEWWATVNRHRHGISAPLTHALPMDRRVLIAVGLDYLHATAADLTLAARTRGPECLLIVCVGASSAGFERTLQACILPIPTKIANELPGAFSSLNQRVAAWLLRDIIPAGPWTRAWLDRETERRLAEVPDLDRSTGKRMDDESVNEWIRKEHTRHPDLGIGEYLLRFRASGFACEESRFRRLRDLVLTDSQGTALAE